MSDFYSAWLERSKSNQKKVDEAPRVAKSKDLKWVRTAQDYKAALMIAPETGFPTGGSCLMRAEIPVGWHTGKHFHGEEAIYVESGEGFLILDEKRYDFFPGTEKTVESFPSVNEIVDVFLAAGFTSFSLEKVEQLLVARCVQRANP